MEKLALNRAFVTVPEQTSAKDIAVAIRAAMHSRDKENWPALTERSRVVVLGEAGTGKTTEFRLQADALRQNGRFAVFVDLISLARDGLRDSISPDDEVQLDAWQSTASTAVFFLDALDEAKLQGRTLEQALRKLHRALKREWDRVHLIISCRVSDWMAGADLAAVRAVTPRDDDDDEPPVHVVQLAPLEDHQVKQLAACVGVEDVSEFMDAIRERDAGVFVERPLDVEWLARYWKRHRRLDRLTELIEDNIRQKLRARAGRQDSLSVAKAQDGVKAVAGLAMLQNIWSIAVPDTEIDTHNIEGTLQLHDVLLDWTEYEQRELLRRPIFDVSTYGRVRFHHRSVQEFLAAEWIALLAEKGLGEEQVDDLFFRPIAGTLAIPPHLGPVAAWLALYDARFRERMIVEAPALLIAYGDPATLPVDARRALINSYARGYADRAQRLDHFDRMALKRLSSPAIAEAIRTLLTNDTAPDELASFLLQMVEAGRIAACAGLALDIALDASRTSLVRRRAIRAAATTGGIEGRVALLDLVHQIESWDQDLAGAFVDTMYPHPLDIDGLMVVLDHTEPKPSNWFTTLQWACEEQVPQIGSLEHRVYLLQQFLLRMNPGHQDRPLVAPGWAWLVTTLARLTAAIIDDWPRGTECPRTVHEALHFCRSQRGEVDGHMPDRKAISTALSNRPDLRRQIFWTEVEARRARSGKVPVTRLHQVWTAHELVDLDHQDTDWLSDDATGKHEVHDRLLAFDALVAVLWRQSEPGELWTRLEVIAAGSPALSRRLKRLRNQPFCVAEEAKRRKWKRRFEARERAQKKREEVNRAALQAVIEEIDAGRHIRALDLMTCSVNRVGDHLGSLCLDELETNFGPNLARAALNGCRAFWRSHDPSLPHERQNPKKFPIHNRLGLIGLHLDFADRLDFRSLSQAHAHIAARYAVAELNGFPPWVESLVESHPDVVRAAWSPILNAELAQSDGMDLHSGVLFKLHRAPDIAKTLVSDLLAEHLSHREPARLQNLIDALAVIGSCPTMTPAAFRTLVRQRCEANLRSPERLGVWWRLWWIRSACSALDWLEVRLSEIEPASATLLMVQVCHRLQESLHGFAEPTSMADREVRDIARLAPIAHVHLPPEDDVEPGPRGFLGPRHQAQYFRDNLLSWLAARPGAETVSTLRRLASDPRILRWRFWLLRKADERLALDAARVEVEVAGELVELYRHRGTAAVHHLRTLSPPVDVGIIAVKDEELAAVLAAFPPGEELHRGGHIYEIAQVDSPARPIRVAITRCRGQANIIAQRAASDLISALSPRFVLLVGIAGGRATADFCLGDIIVSDHIIDMTVEDTGSSRDEGRFSARGRELHPSADKVIEQLPAIVLRDSPWASLITVERPPVPEWEAGTAEAWGGRDAEFARALDEARRRPAPIVRSGCVVSSDKVIKDPTLLNCWRQHAKRIDAVEMESAGVHEACLQPPTPFLAVRGISDIIGVPRDERWTRYACHTAAAFAHALVQSGVLVIADGAERAI